MTTRMALGPRRAFPSRITVTAAAACLTLALGGCGAQSNNASSDNGLGLIIAQSDPILTFDPAMYRGRGTQYVVHQIMDPLVDLDENIEPVPALALEWEQTEDKVWTLTLRQDVNFTNGEPFNADAVKYSFDRILDPATKSPRRSLITSLDRVEVVDEYTVQFHTTIADGAFMKALAYQEIVPPKYMEEVGSEGFSNSPVGTGPFKFVRYTPGQLVAMESNQEYWGDVPKVDNLTVKIIPETASRLAALQSGEAHIINNVPADLAHTLTGNVETKSASGTEVFFLAMNVNNGNFSNKTVRQAMQLAVDPQEIVESVYDGAAEPLNQPAFEILNCYNDEYAGPKVDSDKARLVLADLPPVAIDVVEGEKLLAEVVAGQLKKAGLNVSVNTMDDGAYLAKINEGKSELYLAGWGAGRGTCDEIWRTHFHSSTRELQEFTEYSSPETDELLDTAFSHVPDMDKANEYYHPLMEQLMEDSPWVPIVNPDQIYGVSKSVTGFTPSPIGRYDVNNVEIGK